MRGRSLRRFARVRLLFALALAWATSASPQDLPHIWSRSFGDPDMDTGFGVAVDPSGNVILVGSFAGSLDFGGGSLVSAGDRDVYVAKFDAAGEHLWSARYGSLRTQHAASVAVDDAGDILITGYFMESIDFGGGALVSLGGWDIFAAKLSPQGAHIWSHSYGNYADQWGVAVAVDGPGNVYLTGYFDGAIDFGGGPLPTSGGDDIYLARLDPADGSHVWSRRFGDHRDQVAGGMDVNCGGRIALAGRIEGTTDFGGGPLTASGADAAVAVFDPAGTHIWSQCFGTMAEQNGAAVAIDEWDRVVLTGEFEGGLDLGGGMLVSAGNEDIFLACFDPAGAHLWSHAFGDAEYQWPASVDVDRHGMTVILAGSITGSVDFGGGPLPSAGDYDVSLAAFDLLDGSHLDSRLCGDAAAQYAGFATIGADDRTLLTGHFQGVIDLGGGPLPSSGSWDVYLAAFGPTAQAVVDHLPGATLGIHDRPHLLCYPNPAHGRTDLRYALPRTDHVRISVCDVQGHELAVLRDGPQPAGCYRLNWLPGGKIPPRAASGVCYLRLETPSSTCTEKVVIIR